MGDETDFFIFICVVLIHIQHTINMSGLKRKTGEDHTGGGDFDEMVEQDYLRQKQNRISAGNLLHVGEITHRTPPGMNMTVASDYSTPITLNVPRTSVNPGGLRPLVNAREVKFDLEVNYMAASGIIRLSENSGQMAEATDTETTYFTKDGINYYTDETLATKLNTSHPLAFASAVATPYTETLYSRKTPVHDRDESFTANDEILSAFSCAQANNTRLEMLESVEMRFNNSTTLLKVNKPGRLYSHVNDCYARKTDYCMDVGEITTCPTQWLNRTGTPVEALNVSNDPRRHAAGNWFHDLPIGGRTVHSIYLSDIFPCFDKEELMEMPEFTITFNWTSDYREKLLTLVAPLSMAMNASTESKTDILFRPGVEYVKRYDVVNDQYIYNHLSYTSTALKYQSKALFSVHGITYRAPTYASPTVASPRLFKNTFTDYELTEHSITSADTIVRIVKTLSRPPKGALILFEAKTSETDYVYSKRQWPLQRQVIRITATRAGGLIHQGTNDTMQWIGTPSRRMLRSPLIDNVNEFVGKATRTENNTAVMHAAQFIQHPFLVVNFDNQMDEPQTITKAGQFANFSPDDYTMTLEFDKFDTTISPNDPTVTDDMRASSGRKLLIIYVYDHTFMTDGDTVTTTKVN